MARGSSRQRKKIAKKLALQSVQIVQHKTVQHIKHKPAKPKQTTFEQFVTPKTVKPQNIKEVETVKKISATQKTNKNKSRKLTRKQRIRLKSEQIKQERRTRSKKTKETYRGKAQERYYEENPNKEYTNEAIDMTEEYANEILNDLHNLADGGNAKNFLLNLFYANYKRWGNSYIQTLHDSGFAENIHTTVEEAVARYKGSLPEKWFFQMVDWLNIGLPVDALNLDTDDSEDIMSEFYE